jgi:hypothetical protein
MSTADPIGLCTECPVRPACDSSAWPPVDPEAVAAQRFLVEKAEEAIHDGLQLDRWLREQNLSTFPLELHHAYELPYRAEGFFGTVEINGNAMSVMGCQQTTQFGQIPAGPIAHGLLKDFVLGEFLRRAHWVNADGTPGGFTVRQCFQKTKDGLVARIPPEEREGCPDWRHLGSTLDWALLTIYINDFVVDFGPYRKRFREAVSVVAHPGFVHIVENPSEGDALEVTIGYPVAAYAAIPNYFGFGPGRFHTAVKSFSFLLDRRDELRVRMTFAAAPRCQKVFDFGKQVPDPIYGTASALQRLSLGLWHSDSFHDRMDAAMLAEHSRVHQFLMDGVGRIWQDWLHGHLNTHIPARGKAHA